MENWKICLVAKGFKQTIGLDNEETIGLDNEETKYHQDHFLKWISSASQLGNKATRHQ